MTSIKPKIITVVGTNASGKSSVAIELAKKYKGEIISADSRQIFKGYDLCSGKVTGSERAEVAHFLLDVVNIDEYFSLSDYQSLVYSTIEDITGRGKLPFLVGGTGLYVRAVVDGYNLVGAGPDYGVRAQLESMTIDELLHIVKAKETEIPAYIDPNNKKRLVRACEILLLGQNLNATRTKNPLYQSLQIGVTWDISVVRKRIEERLKSRLSENMIDEVKAGLASGIPYEVFYNHGLEYRFIAQYLNNEFAGYDDFFEKLKTAIGQFAKKQMTWFRKDQSIHWINMEGNYIEEASGLIDTFLELP
ncbi:MAG: tRNA (adenosine(37)-N6)-dimethylallyltransferase MiaA [Dysgonamonadaceae bacterium]|jgi:tRNA dimethylallyltransferase|nr:tRNA (adenosine(37)-N6)-dimethylallyltransferase MiaA [Dysgonamonadaceae bacterium]